MFRTIRRLLRIKPKAYFFVMGIMGKQFEVRGPFSGKGGPLSDEGQEFRSGMEDHVWFSMDTQNLYGVTKVVRCALSLLSGLESQYTVQEVEKDEWAKYLAKRYSTLKDPAEGPSMVNL